MREFTGLGCGRAVQTIAIPLLFLLISSTASAALPDLIINRSRLANSIEIKNQYFAASDCAVIEGCLKSAGNRRLLLFEVAFANIGREDLVIGNPHDNLDLFEYSPCHDHHHFKDAASYELLRSDGRAVLIGRKQAFCLRDNAPYSASAGPSRGYDCDYQGITAGWEDIYPRNLDCQWLDITGLAGGTYTLKITVNPIRVFEEANYANNAASVTVSIPAKPYTRPPARVAPPRTSPPPTVQPPPQTSTYVRPIRNNSGRPTYQRPAPRPVSSPAPEPAPSGGGHTGSHDDDDDD